MTHGALSRLLGLLALTSAFVPEIRAQNAGDEVRVSSRPVPGTEPGARAVRALHQEHWAQALELAELAYERRPDEARSHSLLGECAWRAGFLQRAEDLFQHGVGLNPRHGRNHSGLARALMSQGFDEAAAQSTRLAVQLSPTDATTWLAHAAALARIGQRDQAIDALDQGRTLMIASGRRSVLEVARVRQAVNALDFGAAHSVQLDADQRRGRLPLRIEAGMPIVDVPFRSKDGGSVVVPMLVDTGGALTLILDDAVAETVDHERTGRRTIIGFHDRPVADSGRVRSMTLGEWRFEDVPAVYVPLEPDVDSADRTLPYAGILGPGFAHERVWVLNFRRKSMAVQGSDDRGEDEASEGELRVPFRLLGDGKVVLSLMIGCEPVLALVDSGARQSRRSRRLAEESIWGPLQFRATDLEDTVMRFPPPPVQPMLDDRVSPNLGVEISLLLGFDFLHRFGIVTLDYPHRTLTLTPRDERRR